LNWPASATARSALALSGTFIQEARSHYIQQSLIIAAAALLLTGLLLACRPAR
jgi:hypothetical protein